MGTETREEGAHAMTDRQIIEAINQGEREAREMYLERTGRGVCSFCHADFPIGELTPAPFSQLVCAPCRSPSGLYTLLYERPDDDADRLIREALG